MIFSIILVLVGIYIVVLVGSPMGQLPPLEQEIVPGSTFGTATMLPVFIIGAGVLATICGALYICYSDEK
jgi:hypothetical protein